MLHDDVEVVIRSADDSSEKQIQDIRWFEDNGFDIIIASPNEAEPLTPVINEVMERGVPVIVFDRNVIGDNCTAFRGADNHGIGRMAANYMLSHVGPNARVIEISGNLGSTPALDRRRGFNEALADAPGASVVASASGFWNDERAARAADSLLAIYPDVDAVYAHNDRMAVAAADVAARRGLDPYIIGIDGAPSIGMKAVADGKIDATFIYPTEGYNLIRTAIDILNNKPFEREVFSPASSAVDRTNADILILQDKSLKAETSKIESLKSKVDEYWQKHSIQTTFLYVSVSVLILLSLFLFLFLRAYWQKKRQQAILIQQNRELEEQRDREASFNHILQTERDKQVELNHSLEVERDKQVRLNEEIKEATHSKLVFFTNVSHDLRTPLTLIAEPVSSLAAADNLTPAQKSLVAIADRNVSILKRLINQVLDFRKYENGKSTLNLVEVNLPALIADWTDAFRPIAKNRHIRLSLNVPETIGDDQTMAVDVDKVERVFFNLLSNAFKHTPDNGDISVSVSFSDSTVSLSVTDTGSGISAADLPNIFGRFFQADKVNPQGSGIGLSLAKAFVELHGGKIDVSSRLGAGSTFTVSLPLKHVAVSPAAEKFTVNSSALADTAAELCDDPALPSPAPDRQRDGSELPLLLAVDDNADMLSLLANVLGDSYNIITASNGAEGLRKAAKYIPDLIICDVMMPVMDGFECCRRIKHEVSTSHIPVLLLTACSLDEQRVSGYESGADAYLPKPFSSAVLSARCASLIKNSRRIRRLWHDSLNVSSENPAVRPESPDTAAMATLPSATTPSLSKIDSEFYSRFVAIFNSHIADAEMNVDALAAEMGLGRSQFYRKIKALTNYSPVELIRLLRLREARHRLLTTEKSISEIAYATGFSTPAYFTRCYREEFNETPTATRQSVSQV